MFVRFNQYYIDSERCALFQLVKSGKINDKNIATYINDKKLKLQALYSKFVQIEKDYPTSVEQAKALKPITLDTCFPSCTNIDFNTGDFTGWSGFYGINSSVTNYNITNITGGLLGPVVKGALDPFSGNTYQVHITSKGNVDWFLRNYHGINMPQASPWGGNFSAMIGDSINNGAGVAMLSQKFFVSPGTTNFTYQYAVFLENPNHPTFEQPFFKVAILDQNGDTIPFCGQYVVVSKATIPGFKGEYYPPRNDTIYWKDWTQVNVPLSRYVGQCITVVFEVADCEPTGHCGYAYVDASCSPLAISMPSPMLCGSNSGILDGPAGASRYLWSGPAGGITSNDTLQNITVDSTGTYTLVITPVTGAECRDTLTIHVVRDPGVKITATSVNILCNGGNSGSITANAIGGTGAYTYSWTPTGGTNATATGLSAGKYIVMVNDSFGCSVTDTITLTQPPVLTCTAATLNNVLCNGTNSGSAKVTIAGGSIPYTYVWNPSGQTNTTATGLSAGSYTITVTDAKGCIATAKTTITQPPAFTASASSVNITCNGNGSGNFSATVIGGAPGYKYLWAPCGCTESIVYGATAGTYSVVVTDSNGCTATATTTITQPPVLTAITNILNNVNCNGGNGSANVTVTGGTIAYTYLWTPSGQTNSSATGLSAGNYTVTVTDANGCIATASANITQSAVLSASAATSANVSCAGGNNGSATVIASGGTSPYTYLWTPTGQTNATATGLFAGTYTVTVTDASGCTSTSSVTITEPFVLTATTSTISNVSCMGGNNGSANVIAGGGTNPYVYLWNPSSQTNATATGLIAGTYTVIVTDANNCTATANAVITQPLTLIAAAATATNVSCNGGNNASASATATGGTNPYTYLWNPSSQTNSTATGLSAGSYSVTVTDAHGCTASSTATITQPLALSSTTAVTNVSCNAGNTGSIAATITGGAVPYAYIWNPSGQTNAIASGLTAGNYTVTVSDANGCTLTATASITQPSVLNATLVSSNVTCHNASNGSSIVTVSGGTLPYQYLWTPSGQTNATATGLTAGNYTVTISDSHGCTTTAATTLTQPLALSATTTVASNVNCNGNNNGIANVTTTGGTGPYNYLWNPSGQTNSTANGLSAGNYTVTVTDANGCTDIGAATITEPTLLSLTAKSSAQSVCSGQPVTLEARANGGTAPYTYKWSCGGTTSSLIANPVVTSTYSVTITDANGCKIKATVTIAVNTPLTATSGPNQPICPGKSAILEVFPVGGDGIYSYNWMPGGCTSQLITVTPAATTTYTVIIKDGCNSNPDTVYETIEVAPLPDVKFSADLTQGCSTLCIQFRNPSTINSGNITQWAWNFGDGDTTLSATPVHCYTTPGKYTVMLTATSNYGCSAALTKISYITVFGHPMAAFVAGPQPTTILNPTIQYTDQSSDKDGIINWAWSFGEPGDSNSSYAKNPFHHYRDTGIYKATLIVMNVHGCVDSVSQDG